MSYEDDSDLTSLSESTSDDEPLANSAAQTTSRSTTTKSSAIASKKTPARALRPPRRDNCSVESLYRQLYEGDIDINPEYQRDVVWTSAKQVQLIDSLMNNYYIPPLIFARHEKGEEEVRRTCIDGKQRLSSIQKFMDGHIIWKDSITLKKYYYKKMPNKREKELPPHLKKKFDGTQLMFVEYDDLREDQEREIFQRVQLGVALSPAERLQALNGPVPELIREFRTRFVEGEDKSQYKLDWAKARGRDFQSFAQIAYLIQYGTIKKDPPEPSSTKLEVWLKGTVAPTLKKDTEITVDIFLAIIHNGNLNVPLKAYKVAPIEFVMIAYLIFLHRSQLSLAELSCAIMTLRKGARNEFVDIRFNTRVYKWMMGKIRLFSQEKDGTGKQASAEAEVKAMKRDVVGKAALKKKASASPVDSDADSESEEATPPLRKAPEMAKAPTKPKAKKRKRDDFDNEEDSAPMIKQKAKPGTNDSPPTTASRSLTFRDAPPASGLSDPYTKRTKANVSTPSATPVSAPVYPTTPSVTPSSAKSMKATIQKLCTTPVDPGPASNMQTANQHETNPSSSQQQAASSSRPESPAIPPPSLSRTSRPQFNGVPSSVDAAPTLVPPPRHKHPSPTQTPSQLSSTAPGVTPLPSLVSAPPIVVKKEPIFQPLAFMDVSSILAPIEVAKDRVGLNPQLSHNTNIKQASNQQSFDGQQRLDTTQNRGRNVPPNSNGTQHTNDIRLPQLSKTIRMGGPPYTTPIPPFPPNITPFSAPPFPPQHAPSFPPRHAPSYPPQHAPSFAPLRLAPIPPRNGPQANNGRLAQNFEQPPTYPSPPRPRDNGLPPNTPTGPRSATGNGPSRPHRVKGEFDDDPSPTWAQSRGREEYRRDSGHSSQQNGHQYSEYWSRRDSLPHARRRSRSPDYSRRRSSSRRGDYSRTDGSSSPRYGNSKDGFKPVPDNGYRGRGRGQRVSESWR